VLPPSPTAATFQKNPMQVKKQTHHHLKTTGPSPKSDSINLNPNPLQQS